MSAVAAAMVAMVAMSGSGGSRRIVEDISRSAAVQGTESGSIDSQNSSGTSDADPVSAVRASAPSGVTHRGARSLVQELHPGQAQYGWSTQGAGPQGVGVRNGPVFDPLRFYRITVFQSKIIVC